MDQENTFIVKVVIFDTLSDYYVANCESGCRCHRLNNLACPESLHMWRWRPICPIWKSVQIHALVQLCQKQIETGAIIESTSSNVSQNLALFFHWRMSITPNSSVVGSFTDNHGIGEKVLCQHSAINEGFKRASFHYLMSLQLL